MFELTIIQEKPSRHTGSTISEEQNYFFKDEDIEEMFDLVASLIKAAKYETQYTIRVIEEGQVEE